MTVPVITVDSRDLDEAFDRLVQIGERPAPALDAVGRVLKTRIQEGFVAGTDPYGTPWAPLKIREGKPLRDGGQLMASIDYDVQGNSVIIGTNREHAHVHQFGAVIEPKTRQYLAVPLTEQARRAPGPRSFGTRLIVIETENGLFLFDPKAKIAHYLLTKKVTIPPRPFLPDRGLPESWETDALEAVGDVVRRAWAGRPGTAV